MLDSFWRGLAKHENASQQDDKIMSVSASANTYVTQNLFVNPLKRKLGQDSPLSPSPGQPIPKSVTEIMSHVKIPSPDAQSSLSPWAGKSTLLQQVTANQGKMGDIDAGAFNVFSAHPQDSSSTSTPTKPADGHFDRSTAQEKLKGREKNISTTVLRNIIESQFNLETLLKHRELRLIEQEIAKCQIEYEQLRRCQVIPYPVQSSESTSMIAVSEGSGHIYNNHAPHAPPWGVVEGAYTRHYERWLLPSSTFDDNAVDDSLVLSSAGKRLPDRATRGLLSEQGSVGGQPRSQRGSNSRLQSLPHGYPEPKEEKGPMIVKRSSDNHIVKLVCLDCRRSNFNSVQGFINHCRIAHTRQFASHDAAIEASGEEIDVEAEGGVEREVSAPQGPASAGLVHPMIRSARPSTTDSATLLMSKERINSAANSQPLPNTANPLALSTPQRTSTQDGPSIPFKPSPHTPHLSALLSKLGRGGDLEEIVMDAKMREEIVLEESDSEDSVDEIDEPAPQSRSTRGVVQSSVRPASSSSSMPTPSTTPEVAEQRNATQTGHRALSAIQSPPFHLPYNSNSHRDDQDSSMADISTPFNLSPNTTDPHPAPSLVSDDGDYDNTHSESEVSSHTDIEEDDDHYMHPKYLGHEDLELGESSSINLEHTGKIHGPTAGARPRQSNPIHSDSPHEVRHVSFASPVRKPRRMSKAALE